MSICAISVNLCRFQSICVEFNWLHDFDLNRFADFKRNHLLTVEWPKLRHNFLTSLNYIFSQLSKSITSRVILHPDLKILRFYYFGCHVIFAPEGSKAKWIHWPLFQIFWAQAQPSSAHIWHLQRNLHIVMNEATFHCCNELGKYHF